MTKPPKVPFRDIDPLQDYYRDDQGNMYNVAKLVDVAKEFETFDVPLASLDLSAITWSDCSLYMIAFHVKKVIEADLSKPIILDWNGVVADGRHRIIKALCEGHRTIKAVRLTYRPQPDRVE